MPAIPTIPVTATPTGSATLTGLDRFVDMTVVDFCQFHYGDVGDAQNHCAHFVCHALGLQVGKTCEALLDWAHTRANIKAGLAGVKGYSVRVDDVYNSLAQTAAWSDSTIAPCLIFATLPSNFLNVQRTRMGTQSRKHVGIYSAGQIYHYGNSRDKVRKNSPAEFIAMFTQNYGAGTVFRSGSLPSRP